MNNIEKDKLKKLNEGLANLVPHIQAAENEIEETFTLPQGLVERMADAGLFRLLLPPSLGGFGLHPVAFSQIIEDISRHNGSVGWVLSQQNPFSLYGVYMQDDAARREIYNSGAPFYGISSGPPGGKVLSLERDDVRGGYYLSYEGKFASGINHASYAAAHVRINGKENTLLFRRPTGIDDVWKIRKPMGLHGTGSNGYTFDGFVSDNYIAIRDTKETRRDDYLLYRFSIYQHCGNGSLNFMIGSAQALLDSVIELVRNDKMRHSSTERMRDSGTVLGDLAKARAKIGRTRAFSRNTFSEIYEDLEKRRHDASRGNNRENVELTRADDEAYRLAVVDGSHDCYDAIEMLWRLVGSDAIFEDTRFCRIRNDASVALQQAQAFVGHFESVGKAMVDLDAPPRNPGMYFFGRQNFANILN